MLNPGYFFLTSLYFLILLASSPALASSRTDIVQPNHNAVGDYPLWWRWGQIVVEGSSLRGGSRLAQARSMSALFRLGGDEQEFPFIQSGVNRDPSGKTLHVGLGQRGWINAETRWGVNLFYDYQLNQHHQRLGVGSEMQRNCLKLTVNGYLPLSRQRVTSAEATRPAWGLDTHIDAYLPRCPWVGFRVIGNYYAGTTGIALPPSGFKKRYYPTVMLGLNYLPLPLFKISYDYVIGKQQMRDHRVNLQLIYRFNLSLKEQLQTDQVRHLRTNQGSQLEVVARHSHIVLTRTTSPIISQVGYSHSEMSDKDKKMLDIKKQMDFHGNFISFLEEKDLCRPKEYKVLRQIVDHYFLLFKSKVLEGESINSDIKNYVNFEELYEDKNIIDHWNHFQQNRPVE
jgi:opacity protein-like surface antigen